MLSRIQTDFYMLEKALDNGYLAEKGLTLAKAEPEASWSLTGSKMTWKCTPVSETSGSAPQPTPVQSLRKPRGLERRKSFLSVKSPEGFCFISESLTRRKAPGEMYTEGGMGVGFQGEGLTRAFYRKCSTSV